MAAAIDENCPYTYCEWDEGGDFIGLRGFTLDGIERGKSRLAYEGDYFIRNQQWYELMPKEEFEARYERCF